MQQTRRLREGKIDEYKIKEWFLTHLAGREIANKQKEGHPDFVKKINVLFQKIMNQSGAVEAYRQIVRQYTHKVNFRQNISNINSIIINFIDLLIWLREKGLSDRDLKPDNILVAADRGEYSRYLAYAGDFHLGLIDVETATVIKSPESRKIKQPPLGGTPSYLTPTHFFKNDILIQVFGDLPKILHFQDFHAVTVMIFEIVTGEHLFEKTSKLTNKILLKIKDAMQKRLDMIKVAKEVSVLFWENAQQEFEEKIKNNKELLTSVSIEVFPEAEEMLRGYIYQENKTLSMAIQQFLHNQKVFTSENNLKYLEESPLVNIVKLKQKWQKKESIPNVSEQIRLTIIKILDILGILKKRQEQFNLKMDPLFRPMTGSSEVVLSIYELLIIMFELDVRTLYRKGWCVTKTAIKAKPKTGHITKLEKTKVVTAEPEQHPIHSTKILEQESTMDTTGVIKENGYKKTQALEEAEPDTTQVLRASEGKTAS